MNDFLLLTEADTKTKILVNTSRNDFIKKDCDGRAVFINKNQPDLTVEESFEAVIGLLRSMGC